MAYTNWHRGEFSEHFRCYDRKISITQSWGTLLDQEGSHFVNQNLNVFSNYFIRKHHQFQKRFEHRVSVTGA